MKRVISHIRSFFSSIYKRWSNLLTTIRLNLEFWRAPKDLEPVVEVKDVKEFLGLWAPQYATLKKINFFTLFQPNDQCINPTNIDVFIARLKLCSSLERVCLDGGDSDAILKFGSADKPYAHFIEFIEALHRSRSTLTHLSLSSPIIPNLAGVQSPDDKLEDIDVAPWTKFCEFISSCPNLAILELQNSALMRLFVRRPIQTKQFMDAIAACPKLELIDFSGNSIGSSWRGVSLETTVANVSAAKPRAMGDYLPGLLELFRNPNLKELILQNMNMYTMDYNQWQQLSAAATKHPKLQFLDLSDQRNNRFMELSVAEREKIQNMFKTDGRALQVLFTDPNNIQENASENNAKTAPGMLPGFLQHQATTPNSVEYRSRVNSISSNDSGTSKSSRASASSRSPQV